MALTHPEICEIGAKWLRNSRYHNCKSVMIECGSFEERPDVIGFRYNNPPYGSVLLEVKVSRGDFFSDRNKPHRAEGRGMGKWRYYVCPKDMIQPHELPDDSWGLLYVSDKGRVKVIKGVFEEQNYSGIQRDYEKYIFPCHDKELENRLLAINLQAMMYNEESELDFREMRKRYNKQLKQIQELEREPLELKRRLEVVENELARANRKLAELSNFNVIKTAEIQNLHENIGLLTGNIEY